MHSIAKRRKPRPAAAAVLTPRSAGTILVVCSDDAHRRLIAEALRGKGFFVLEAQHGGHALLTCMAHLGPIHLLLMDLMMPDVSGPQLARRLMKVRPEARTLFLSEDPEELSQFGADADGADAPIMRAPFTIDKLVRKVRAVMDSDTESQTA